MCLEEGCKLSSGNGEDYCAICWVEGLNQAPSIKLDCGHLFHKHCVEKQVSTGWVGSRILFNFLNCPSCKKEIHHPKLESKLKKHYKLKKQVVEKAKKRVHLEGLNNDPRLSEKGGKYYKVNRSMISLERS